MGEFQKRLVEAMELNGITQAELAEKTKLSKPRISQYVNGVYEAKQDALLKLAKALNVDVAWLMGYDVPMNKAEKKLQELAEDKHDTDMLLEYFGMLNDKGRELALVYVKSLSDMKDFQKESSVQTSTA